MAGVGRLFPLGAAGRLAIEGRTNTSRCLCVSSSDATVEHRPPKSLSEVSGAARRRSRFSPGRRFEATMAESRRNGSVSIDDAMAVPMACRADLAAAVIRLRTQSRSSPAVKALCAAAQKRSVCESVETEALSLFSTPSINCQDVWTDGLARMPILEASASSGGALTGHFSEWTV